MSLHLSFGLAVVACTTLGGLWLGWQLLRQNGRILLRLEELEKRLDELQFGGADEPGGLPLGSEAPAFELPDLTGDSKSLAGFRSQPLLLIFFNPDCGFCREMTPKLAALLSEGQAPRVPVDIPRLHDSNRDDGDQGLVELGPPVEGKPQLVIITAGDAEKNRWLFAAYKVGCPVLLETDGEVAKAYLAHGTPSGYLVSPDGKIASKLAMGAEALFALATTSRGSRGNEAQTSPSQPSTFNSQPESQSLLTSAVTEGNGRASRFGNRSLANSKIKRDGLKAGTPAPDFRLPRLDGKGDLSLSELRGKRVLLVFSSPGCGPCNALMPELEKFHRQHRKIELVMIGKGEPTENRAKVKEHKLTFPIVLQQQWEISRRYAMFATPIAYLIDETGVIVRDVAPGTDAILDLMAQSYVMPVETHHEALA